MNADHRILVLMPTMRDAERTRQALARAALDCSICQTVAALCLEIERGAGAVLLIDDLLDVSRIAGTK